MSALENLGDADDWAAAEATISSLRAENERLRAALLRLGSIEAFDMPRVIDERADAELLARIDYARAAIDKARGAT